MLVGCVTTNKKKEKKESRRRVWARGKGCTWSRRMFVVFLFVYLVCLKILRRHSSFASSQKVRCKLPIWIWFVIGNKTPSISSAWALHWTIPHAKHRAPRGRACARMLYLFEVIVQMYFVSIKFDVIDLPSKRGIRSIIALKNVPSSKYQLKQCSIRPHVQWAGVHDKRTKQLQQRARASRKGHEGRLGLFR